MAGPILEVKGATKSFGAVRALAGADLTLGDGEILAILGDNGAGKSTLIKSISGVHTLDDGQIYFRGEPVNIRRPADANALGIETVYQDLALFDNLTAIQNFFAGRELCRGRWMGRLARLHEKRMAEETQEIVRSLEVGVPDLHGSLGLMSGGQRQAIAVARAVSFASSVVILDEPTAALGLRERANVIKLIRRLPQRGASVILISHNLEEVADIANRAVVMRNGRVVGEAIPTAANHELLVSLIVGAARKRDASAELNQGEQKPSGN
jgi:ABC-type sugar transport system ATPase subunit